MKIEKIKQNNFRTLAKLNVQNGQQVKSYKNNFELPSGHKYTCAFKGYLGLGQTPDTPKTFEEFLSTHFQSDKKSAIIIPDRILEKETNMEYELNLTPEELSKRVDDEVLTKYTLLDEKSNEFLSLDEGDKEALKHLTCAAYVLDNVFLRQDNEHNIPFKNYLLSEIKKNNEDAKKTFKIFTSQKGIEGVDNLMQKVRLAKGIESTLGKGFYPEDLGKEEFHKILLNMLNDGKIEEVKKILNQRTMVVRQGDELRPIDYTEFFKDEFSICAQELRLASQTSTNKLFNEFLIHQASALESYNPDEDILADKTWALMQDTPLEFTITRENYADELTKTIPENQELSEMLKKYDISVFPKDSIGARVGIVNKEGTEKLLGIKKYLPLIAEEMPFCSQYVQKISQDDNKQTMADVDLVIMSGDSSTIRAGIVVAENLPNADKDSLKHGGGRRNVYHRQIRQSKSKDDIKKKLLVLLNDEQHKYYNEEANHRFVIGHENMHTLGPKEHLDNLGKYMNLIEEIKADVGSIASLNLLVKEKFYTKDEADEIVVVETLGKGTKSMPQISQTHRAGDVIEFNYLLSHGAFSLDSEGKMTVDIEKAKEASYEMLSDIVNIQLKHDFELAENFVKKYFVWGEKNEIFAQNLKKVSKKLSGELVMPLADKFTEEKE